MSDAMSIQNYDLGSVAIGNNEYKSINISFPGADTYAEGTIMALKEVDDTIAVVADGGNTGDGTVTSAAPAPGDVIPLTGAYNLECTFGVTNGGVFKLEDPNGNIVADNLTLRVGAGLATTFVVAGMTFIITDGAADFIAGDKFALTVTAVSKAVIYSPSGIGGAQEPRYVLREEYVATGAGDIGGRVMTAGKVRTDRLIIDPNAAGVGITDAVKDKLRHYGINPIDTTDLSQLDNQ